MYRSLTEISTQNRDKDRPEAEAEAEAEVLGEFALPRPLLLPDKEVCPHPQQCCICFEDMPCLFTTNSLFVL